MPVQRIWLRSADGTEKPLTAGPADTADYTPQVTPGGKHLIFLRLDRVDSGSLTELSLVTGKETSLGRLTGGPGFTATITRAGSPFTSGKASPRSPAG